MFLLKNVFSGEKCIAWSKGYFLVKCALFVKNVFSVKNVFLVKNVFSGQKCLLVKNLLFDQKYIFGQKGIFMSIIFGIFVNYFDQISCSKCYLFSQKFSSKIICFVTFIFANFLKYFCRFSFSFLSCS